MRLLILAAPFFVLFQVFGAHAEPSDKLGTVDFHVNVTSYYRAFSENPAFSLWGRRFDCPEWNDQKSNIQKLMCGNDSQAFDNAVGSSQLGYKCDSQGYVVACVKQAAGSKMNVDVKTFAFYYGEFNRGIFQSMGERMDCHIQENSSAFASWIQARCGEDREAFWQATTDWAAGNRCGYRGFAVACVKRN